MQGSDSGKPATAGRSGGNRHNASAGAAAAGITAPAPTGAAADEQPTEQPKKAAGGSKRRSGPKSKSSPYVGVTQYKRTGFWEAHIWIQNPKGKGYQRHLGSYATAADAARCYDRACLKLRGEEATLNFARAEYEQDPFMLEHDRTDKLRFLDVLRARFAMQTGSGQHARPAAAAAEPRARKRAASSDLEEEEEEEAAARPSLPRTRTVVRVPRGPGAAAVMAAAAAAQAAQAGFGSNGFSHVAVHAKPASQALLPFPAAAAGGLPRQPSTAAAASEELIHAPLMYAGQLGVTPCSSPGRALGLLPVAETLGGSEGAAGASGALSFGLLSGLAPAGDGRETAAPLPLFVGGEHGAGAGIDWTAVFASHR